MGNMGNPHIKEAWSSLMQHINRNSILTALSSKHRHTSLMQLQFGVFKYNMNEGHQSTAIYLCLPAAI